MGCLGAGGGLYSGLCPAAEGRKKSVGLSAPKPLVVHPLLGGFFFGLAGGLAGRRGGAALAHFQVVDEVLANAAEGLNRVVGFFGLSERIIEEVGDFMEAQLREQVAGGLYLFGGNIGHVFDRTAGALLHEEIGHLERLGDALSVSVKIDPHRTALAATIEPVVVREEDLVLPLKSGPT